MIERCIKFVQGFLDNGSVARCPHDLLKEKLVKLLHGWSLLFKKAKPLRLLPPILHSTPLNREPLQPHPLQTQPVNPLVEEPVYPGPSMYIIEVSPSRQGININ